MTRSSTTATELLPAKEFRSAGAPAPTPAPTSLLLRVARGEPDAMRACIEQYQNLVWSIVSRRMQPADAEDLVQEIFMELWRTADRFDPARGSEANFIAVVTRRRLIDRVRRQPPLSLEDGESALHSTPDPATLQLNAWEEDAELARGRLAKLPTDQQTVLRLAVEQGLTYVQIASQLGLPLGTVKSHARRGLMRLREWMRSDDEETGGPP